MTIIQDVCRFLDSFAPLRLAEDWDNVGLLVGDPSGTVQRIMTCLTVTPESAQEAIDRRAELIVSHHPLPFRPLKRVTTENTSAKLLWDLIRAGISIYSPHTSFDSASEGINQALASRLGLSNVEPLIPVVDDPDSLGAGRIGNIDGQTLSSLVTHIKQQFQLTGLQVAGEMTRSVSRVAVACGSGGSFLEHARVAGCDTFVTGETNFHTCLEASANDISLILLGHYASERFAIERLAQRLAQNLPDLEIWASEEESDPLAWV